MNEQKKKAIDYVASREDTIVDISHKIWEFAELSLKEFKSAEYYIQKLKEEGFEVTENVCGLKTAFYGKFGSGRPYIGVLAEFDALAGLSQEAGVPEPKPIVPGESGHGCGHNMLGAGSFGAALGIKKYLEETGKSGTVIFYGCPGEEGGASKALMARDGIWNDLDAALTWHPGDANEVSTGSWNACIQVLYKFYGKAAHAAGNPHMGRSALDAVELMNTGVNYLREHMKPDARIHYAMIDGGGWSPNVVQPTASVLYMVRSPRVKEAIELEKRVDLCAVGAATMTETRMEKLFVDGCSDGVPNSTLEKVLYKNMEEIPVPEYTEAEWKLAEGIKAKCESDGKLPGNGANHDKEIAKFVKEKTDGGKLALNNFVMPYYTGEEHGPGSSDVGDVSWCIPTAQIRTVCFVSGAPGHSWQNVSCGASPIGDKGTVYAAKVLCGAAIDLLEDQSLIEAAKAEFKERAAEGYFCPVPEGAELLVIE